LRKVPKSVGFGSLIQIYLTLTLLNFGVQKTSKLYIISQKLLQYATTPEESSGNLIKEDCFASEIEVVSISTVKETGMFEGVKELCALWTNLSRKQLLDDSTFSRLELVCKLAKEVHYVLRSALEVDEVGESHDEYIESVQEDKTSDSGSGSENEDSPFPKTTIQDLQRDISNEELADSLPN
jgi:hypothetical protein